MFVIRVDTYLKQLLLKTTVERIFFIQAENLALFWDYMVQLRIIRSRFPARIPRFVITFSTYREMQSIVSYNELDEFSSAVNTNGVYLWSKKKMWNGNIVSVTLINLINPRSERSGNICNSTLMDDIDWIFL